MSYGWGGGGKKKIIKINDEKVNDIFKFISFFWGRGIKYLLGGEQDKEDKSVPSARFFFASRACPCQTRKMLFVRRNVS